MHFKVYQYTVGLHVLGIPDKMVRCVNRKLNVKHESETAVERFRI